MEDVYLGDGVYISYNGYNIELDLRGQDNYTKITLEPIVFKQLLEFLSQIEEFKNVILEQASKIKGN